MMLVLADKRALPAASVLWSKTIRVFVQMLTAESRGRAGQSRAGQSRAGQGRAGQGRAGQGRAGQGRAGQGTGRVERGQATFCGRVREGKQAGDRGSPVEVDGVLQLGKGLHRRAIAAPEAVQGGAPAM